MWKNWGVWDIRGSNFGVFHWNGWSPLQQCSPTAHGAQPVIYALFIVYVLFHIACISLMLHTCHFKNIDIDIAIFCKISYQHRIETLISSIGAKNVFNVFIKVLKNIFNVLNAFVLFRVVFLLLWKHIRTKWCISHGQILRLASISWTERVFHSAL